MRQETVKSKKFCPPILIHDSNLKRIIDFVKYKSKIDKDNFKVVNNNRKIKSKFFVRDFKLRGEILEYLRSIEVKAFSFTPKEKKFTNLLLKNINRTFDYRNKIFENC
jgi:hypothetical protein